MAVALAVALLGERFGVFGKFKFCAVGELDFVAAAFACDFYDDLVFVVSSDVFGDGVGYDGVGYGFAIGSFNFFPVAVVAEIYFGAACEVDLVFGAAASLLFFGFSNVVAGEVLGEKCLGGFG